MKIIIQYVLTGFAVLVFVSGFLVFADFLISIFTRKYSHKDHEDK